MRVKSFQNHDVDINPVKNDNRFAIIMKFTSSDNEVMFQ
jgi:hypothetical protein